MAGARFPTDKLPFETAAMLKNPMPHQYVVFHADGDKRVFYIMSVHHRIDNEGYWKDIYGYWMKPGDLPEGWSL